ncbi:hypothetical protein ACFWAT_08680 [Streptomyces syringium]|uniref:hypothetical protein n=1 Tax=Streptomyces syringium TaxID=76729 RepID=UPI003662699B
MVLITGSVGGFYWIKHNETAKHYAGDRTRTLAGLLVVAASDAAIIVALIWGAGKLAGQDAAVLVGVLTGAFTAISTMTTAYLGIRAVSNAAQGIAWTLRDSGHHDDGGSGGPDGDGQRPPGDGGAPGPGDEATTSDDLESAVAEALRRHTPPSAPADASRADTIAADAVRIRDGARARRQAGA